MNHALSVAVHNAKQALLDLKTAQLHAKEPIHPYDLVQMRNCLDVIAMEIPPEQLAAYERKDAA